jgi:hypothetical protein
VVIDREFVTDWQYCRIVRETNSWLNPVVPRQWSNKLLRIEIASSIPSSAAQRFEWKKGVEQ